MEDREIIELYNYRSENALVETDKKYGKLVTFLICKLIKNTLDVEECRNDTYLGVWMTIPPIIPDSLKAYLLKIARNQALKKYEYIHAAKRDIDKCVPYEELSNYLAKEYMDDWKEKRNYGCSCCRSNSGSIIWSWSSRSYSGYGDYSIRCTCCSCNWWNS